MMTERVTGPSGLDWANKSRSVLILQRNYIILTIVKDFGQKVELSFVALELYIVKGFKLHLKLLFVPLC